MRKLFRSQTSFELLRTMSLSPSQSWTLTELARLLDKDSANVLRELAILQEEGYVSVGDEDKKTYRFNQQSFIKQELQALFLRLEEGDFSQRFKRTWLLAEDIPNMCPFFSKIWLECFVKQFAEPGGRAYERVVAIYRDYHICFYYDEYDAHAVAEHLVKKMAEDPGFMEEVNRQIITTSDALKMFSEHLPDARLESLSDDQVWSFYAKHEELHTQYYQWGWIPPAADMFGGQLTEYGKRLLHQVGVAEERLNEVLSLLTQPTRPSLLKEEQDALARIGCLVQADPNQLVIFKDLFRKLKEEDVKLFGLYEHTPKYEEHFEGMVRALVDRVRPDVLKAVRDHYATYFYTRFLFTEEQGTYSFEHYLKSLVRLVNADPDLAATLRREAEQMEMVVIERKRCLESLSLSKDQVRFFDAWGEFMVTKIYRRFAQLFALYRMVPVIEDIGRRLGLTIKEVKFMTTQEIHAALFDRRLDVEAVRARVSLSAYYADATGGAFYSGKMAKRIAKEIESPAQALTQEIRGQCGCPGVVSGIVRIVNIHEDMSKVSVGDILVSISTQPDLIPAMKKAAGFVTDQGGVTSHAAIVAREMNKPCVIGTKHASKVLKDGMKVEVDANKGVVRVLE